MLYDWTNESRQSRFSIECAGISMLILLILGTEVVKQDIREENNWLCPWSVLFDRETTVL